MGTSLSWAPRAGLAIDQTRQRCWDRVGASCEFCPVHPYITHCCRWIAPAAELLPHGPRLVRTYAWKGGWQPLLHLPSPLCPSSRQSKVLMVLIDEIVIMFNAFLACLWTRLGRGRPGLAAIPNQAPFNFPKQSQLETQFGRCSLTSSRHQSSSGLRRGYWSLGRYLTGTIAWPILTL